jgi:DNA polymerase III subunit delta'
LRLLPGLQASPTQLEAVIPRAEGGLRRAIRLLDPETLLFAQRIEAMIAELPKRDEAAIAAIAEATRSGPLAEQALDDLLAGIETALEKRLQDSLKDGVSRHKPAEIAEFWTRMGARARQTDALNLDRRAFVMTLLDDLAGL